MSKTKTVHSDPSAAFSETVADVLLALNADEQGLTSTGASQRLTQYGPNELPGAKPQPIWLRLLSQFNNALIWFMLAGAAAAPVFAFEVWFALHLIVVGLPHRQADTPQ